MDITSTMGFCRAAFNCGNPPISEKRLRSPKALNWLSQNSGVMLLLEEMLCFYCEPAFTAR